MRNALILLSMGVLLSVCACRPEVSDGREVSSDASHGDAIAWYEGEVDAAFMLAKAENKPLFLYWGAEWCPPCHHLKATVFKRPEFVAKTREFVPVYLDGDSERAQILAEELGVTSYPTVLIFSPEGEEIMRMPTYVDVEQYVSLLDSALTRMRPVGEVLAEVLDAGAARAPAEELSLLAYYSWGQDDSIEWGEEETYRTFATLFRDTPDELAVEKSRFLALALEAAIDHARGAGEDETPRDLPADELATYRSAVIDLLENPDLCSANLSFVFEGAGATVPFLHPDATPDRDRLVAMWDEAARRIENDETLSIDDRLTAIVPRLELATLPEEARESDEPVEPPAELVDHVRKRVAWAAEAVTDEGELQTVMSTMAWLLGEVGLTGEAEALLTERMDDAHAPYYFMSVMARMKKDADQAGEAVAWYRKAYDSARGRYSRFRWGSIYLRQVMDLAPEDATTIESDSIEILGELLTFEDAFAGGNYMRLGQLESAYRSWNDGGEHDALVGRIRDLVLEKCEDYPELGDDSQRVRCRSFLTEAGPEQAS